MYIGTYGPYIFFFHYSLLLVIIEESVRCEHAEHDRLIISLLEIRAL